MLNSTVFAIAVVVLAYCTCEEESLVS